MQAPPLQREHRLYQADWLLRFYEFSVEDIAPAQSSGMLDLDVDPKLAWALRNPERFPVDLNAAPREMLLRVPGLGTRNVGVCCCRGGMRACGLGIWHGCACQ